MSIIVCFYTQWLIFLLYFVVHSYTAEEDFAAADAVFDCIGDPPEVRFDLGFCANLLQKQYVSW